ncbi:hypothetical protein V2J09_008161 [Rumex salicifolius]
MEHLLYYFINTRREMRKKASFFKRNDGFLLQKQLTSDEGFVERTKIFTINELEKATDYLNENPPQIQSNQIHTFPHNDKIKKKQNSY